MQNFILRDPTSKDLEYLDKIKFTQQQIEERAKDLCLQITSDYQNIDILVSIMDGGYYWSNLLEKNLKPAKRINSSISYYDDNIIKKMSDDELNKVDFANKNVLISEDIIATGRTISEVIKIISDSQPKLVVVCTMIDKPQVRTQKYLSVNKYIKYVGFECPKNEFLCGYGMKGISPLPEDLRHIKDIYSVKETPVLYWEFTKE